MSFNGAGVFQRIYSWQNDAAANIKIRADRMDNEDDGFAVGLSTCITKDGQTTVTANLPMATWRHTGVGDAQQRNQYASFGQVQDGKTNWVVAGGTADALTATYSIPITALVDGQTCFVRATAANATTTPTFSPNALTARTIVKTGGVALVAGDIVGAGHELELRYNLANTRWELMNPRYAAPVVPFTFASAATPAYLDLAEDTDNGSNRIRLIAPASIAADVSVTLPGVASTLATLTGTEALDNKTLNRPDIVGITNGSSAAAGSVGEVVSSILGVGSAVSLSTGVVSNITSISLSAGDWEISGIIAYQTAASTSVTQLVAGITPNSGSLASLASIEQSYASQITPATVPGVATIVIPLATCRQLTASPITIYLTARSNFTVSTMTAYGWIKARRVR